MSKYLLVIFVVLSHTVVAQRDSVRVNDLDEVVVSANKFEQQKRFLPYQIEQITAKQIAFRNSQTTADALMQSGHVFVQKSQGGGGSTILRGFEANRVLLVVDGVRLNNAIFRGGHLQNVLRIDQSLIERTEILLGPSSVMYGSDALGGVIHFRTRDPKLNTSIANGYYRYSSANNESTTHADLSVGSKKIALLLSATVSDFKDMKQGAKRSSAYPDFGKRAFYVVRENDTDVSKTNTDPNLQIGSGYRQIDSYAKVIYQASNTTKHSLNLQYSSSSDVVRYDRLTEGTAAAPTFAEWYYGPEKRLLAAYKLENSTKNALQDRSQVVVSYQDIEESRHSRRFKNDARKSQIENVKIASLNFDAAKQLGINKLQYGFEVSYNDVQSTAFRTNVKTAAITTADTRYPDGGSQMSWAAVYVSNQINITDNVAATAGFRYNWVSLQSKFVSKEFYNFPFDNAQQHPSAPSGNIGLVYLPGLKTKLNVGITTGFRAPNVDDMNKLFDSKTGSVVVPNANLKPEYALNYEIGLSQIIGQRLRLEASAYYTQLHNAIVVDAFSFNGQSQILYNNVMSKVLANQNKAEAYIKGLSVNVFAKLSPTINASFNYNSAIGKIKNAAGDTPLDHIPPSFGRGSLWYQGTRWQAEAFVNYNGWKRLIDYKLDGEDNAIYATADGMPAWWTANVRASFDVTKNIVLQAACENVLDQNYRTFASGFSGAGRNFVLTLRLKY
jgi:hemoglobin/transferrin/lactoferrin receptor protein